MGLIRAAINSIGGSLGDQWLEVIEPGDMGDGVVFTKGIRSREKDGQKDRRDSNRKGTSDAISNGSIIRVYDNQAALLVDGGKIVDFAAEPGDFKVDDSSLPSIFSGSLGDSVKHTFERFKFGGANPTKQEVFYVNLQEIKGIKFGTPNALQYFDNFYNAELFVRTHGNYSIKITDPILFYKEAIPRNATYVKIEDINEQYLSEFLEALQASINQLSMEGLRISNLPAKMPELSRKMRDVLDDDWTQMRGFEVQAVGISSISYTEDSQELINMRNKGAMLGDPSIREGYVQGSIARGLEEAGKNPAGAAATFMGMGMGMNQGGSYMAQASESNRRQMEAQQAAQAQAAQQAPTGAEWICPECQTPNTGNFCTNCGSKKPATAGGSKFCSNCGHQFGDIVPKFCPECGAQQ